MQKKQCRACHTVIDNDLGYCEACGFEQWNAPPSGIPLWQRMAGLVAIGAVIAISWVKFM